MRTEFRLMTALTVTYCVFAIYGSIVPSLLSYGLLLLNALTLVIILIVSLIMYFSTFRTTSQKWKVPAACFLVVLSVAFAGALAVYIGNLYFEQHIALYAKVVGDIKSGVISSSEKFGAVNVKKLPPHIKAVSAVRCPDGSLIVEFFVNTGIPLAHLAYLYKDYIREDNCILYKDRPEQRWLNQRKITENWYRVSD